MAKTKNYIPVDKLTRSFFQDRGYVVDKAEYYNKAAGIKKDLFGFCDFVGLKEKIVAIQATSYAMHSVRRNKITGKYLDRVKDLKERIRLTKVVENAKAWIQAGGIICIISWKKGKMRNEYHQRIEQITYDMFEL